MTAHIRMPSKWSINIPHQHSPAIGA
jgi:hypothetical protein